MSETAIKAASGQEPPTVRGPDYLERYAQIIRFELSTIDLKLVFGSMDQFAIPATLRQHTGITITWQQAKILAYFIVLNIQLHEAVNGKVPVPTGIIPEAFDVKAFEQAVGKTVSSKISAMAEQVRSELFGV